MPLAFAYLSYGLHRAGFHGDVFHTDKTKKAAAIVTPFFYPLFGAAPGLIDAKSGGTTLAYLPGNDGFEILS